MKYFNKKLFSLTFLALFSYLNAEDCFFEDSYPISCEDCGEWFVTADFIYWKAHTDNLEYAYEGTSDPITLLPRPAGTSKHLEWRWEPGFKVGIGRRLNDSWDIYLNYTWLYSRARGSAFSATGALIPNFFSPFDAVTLITDAASDWHLHYHTLDLEVGDWLCLNSCFSFRPNFGLRGAWTRDSDSITYITIAGIPVNYNYHEEFNGVGPRVGLNVNWGFCDHWSIFADGYLSLLWGKYDESVRETVSTTLFIDARHDFYTLKTLTDLKIGFGWDTFLCNDRHLTIQLAWEQRVWFKHNEYQRLSASSFSYDNNDADLTLYGVTLTACLEF